MERGVKMHVTEWTSLADLPTIVLVVSMHEGAACNPWGRRLRYNVAKMAELAGHLIQTVALVKAPAKSHLDKLFTEDGVNGVSGTNVRNHVEKVFKHDEEGVTTLRQKTAVMTALDQILNRRFATKGRVQFMVDGETGEMPENVALPATTKDVRFIGICDGGATILFPSMVEMTVEVPHVKTLFALTYRIVQWTEGGQIMVNGQIVHRHAKKEYRPE